MRLSRNRSGSINVRGLIVLSHAPGDNQVPFYFQPTLGGANLNGDRLLQGFERYRRHLAMGRESNRKGQNTCVRSLEQRSENR